MSILREIYEEAMDKRIRQVNRNKNKIIRNLLNPPIDDQTIMFWNLQLQFMQMDRFRLGALMLYYSSSTCYQNNKYSKKAKDLADRARWGWTNSTVKPFTEDEHDCLATHLALQLSGLA